MKTDSSFSALILTMVLFGAFLFLLMLLKLPENKTPKAPQYQVAYTKEVLEETPPVENTPLQKIETHNPFNEAKEFIEAQERERIATQETFQQKVHSIDQTINNTTIEKNILKKPKKTITTSEGSAQKITESTNRNTTTSYRLIDRTALYFPNPVYICEGSGKVVISIKVNDNGKVIEANFSEKLSATSNACLVEVAINYASKTTFSTKANKPLQLGTITYQFPGQ